MHSFIDEPIQELDLSPGFVQQSKAMGFSSIREILALSADELTRLEGFSYHWLSELSRFLQAKGALHLLQG